MPDSQILLLIVSWLVYFGLHSLLASIGVKQYVATRWPRAMPAYRLVFNVLAVVLLAVPLWLLYEFGIFISSFMGKPAPAEEEPYQPLDEVEMDAEFDRMEAAEKQDPKQP